MANATPEGATESSAPGPTIEFDDPLGIVAAAEKGWEPSFVEPVPPSTSAPAQPEGQTTEPGGQEASTEPQASGEDEDDESPERESPQEAQTRFEQNFDRYRGLALKAVEDGKGHWKQIPGKFRDAVARSIGPEAQQSLDAYTQKVVEREGLLPRIDATSQARARAAMEADNTRRAQVYAAQQQAAAIENMLIQHFGDPAEFADDLEFAQKAQANPEAAKAYIELVQRKSQPPQVYEAQQAYFQGSVEMANQLVANVHNHPWFASFPEVRQRFEPSAELFAKYGEGPGAAVQWVVEYALEIGRAAGKREAMVDSSRTSTEARDALRRQVAAEARRGLPTDDGIQGETGSDFGPPPHVLNDERAMKLWVADNVDRADRWLREGHVGVEVEG